MCRTAAPIGCVHSCKGLKLNEVYVYEEELVPAFSQAIFQGCCQDVECMIFLYREETRPECGGALIGALEIDGVLLILWGLSVHCHLSPGAIPQLARALARGTAPQLTDLSIDYCGDSDLEALADMMEVRARLPNCKGLERFVGDSRRSCWFDETAQATRIRLVRALLPSVQYLPLT